MLLSKITKYINCKKIYNLNKDISFNFLSTNSKNIKKNSILVINRKNKFKKKYIFDAIDNGALALITNHYFQDVKIPQFLVKTGSPVPWINNK